MQHRIHIYGASGSGVTTLGAALSERLRALHLDTDEFYWKQTEIPYTEKNTPEQRIENIRESISDHQSWVLSGSLCSWGGPLTDLFTLAIFVYLDKDVRLKRLIEREKQRFGRRIDESGDLYEKHIEFVVWAAKYDTASPPTRSLIMHREWASKLDCPVVEVNSYKPVDELVHYIADGLQA